MGSESSREIARLQESIRIKRNELKSPYASSGQKESIRNYIADCRIQIQNIKNNSKRQRNMGTTGNSFKREIGKNTGKFVSNLFFGDRHSTPYRRVDNSNIARNESVLRQKDNEMLCLIDKAVLQNIDAIASIRFSRDKEELTNQLLDLSVQLKANRWHETLNDKEGSIRNKFTNALFEKYKQGVESLKYVDPNNARLRYFEKLKRQTIIRKLFGTYRTFAIIISFITLVALGVGVSILAQEGLLWMIPVILIAFALIPTIRKILKLNR